MAQHNELGKWGEEMAVAYLREQRFAIIDRDWHSGHRDLDIVAMDGDVMVFVEVKTRRNRRYGDPLDAIDSHKRAHLRQSIDHYVKSHPARRAYRVDIVGVVGEEFELPEITHIRDIKL